VVEVPRSGVPVNGAGQRFRRVGQQRELIAGAVHVAEKRAQGERVASRTADQYSLAGWPRS
jgi:hypothetical protein